MPHTAVEFDYIFQFLLMVHPPINVHNMTWRTAYNSLGNSGQWEDLTPSRRAMCEGVSAQWQ